MNYRKIIRAFKPSDNISKIFKSSLIASLGCHNTVSDNLLYLKDHRIYLAISLAYLYVHGAFLMGPSIGLFDIHVSE